MWDFKGTVHLCRWEREREGAGVDILLNKGTSRIFPGPTSAAAVLSPFLGTVPLL